MRRTIAAVGTRGLVALVVTPMTAANAADDATVSVLHAVPGLTVDVYANGEELIPDFEPGTLTDPLEPAGRQLRPPGLRRRRHTDSGEPAIEANDVEVPAGANATVVAHLDADGNPKLSVFANDTAATAAGEARLTVRHTAAAPGVDVRADGNRSSSATSPTPTRTLRRIPAGSYSADVVLAGTEDVAIGPADVSLAEGVHTIVYAWGSAEDGNLELAVQTIDGLHLIGVEPLGAGWYSPALSDRLRIK